MSASHASQWSRLFDEAVSIIDQADARFGIDPRWTFGGGTALMLQIDHRESFDVDIFIDGPQLLPYLDPVRHGYALDRTPGRPVTDGLKLLKIAFADVGEIYFICAAEITARPAVDRIIRGRTVALERTAVIIAKKIHYRGASLQPRDMFDMASVAKVLGRDMLVEALAEIPRACETALAVVRRMDPAFARALMESLAYREAFASLPAKAQSVTEEVLAEALSAA